MALVQNYPPNSYAIKTKTPHQRKTVIVTLSQQLYVSNCNFSQRMSWHDNSDNRPSDVEPSVLKLWGMQSTLSQSLLLGPLWPQMVAPESVLSMGQIRLFNI